MQPVLQANASQQIDRPRPIGLASAEAHPQQDVFQRRKRRQQIEGLKDEADLLGPKTVAGRFNQ